MVNSLGQVGVLYTYIMLVTLAFGLGYLALKSIDSLVNWIRGTNGNVGVKVKTKKEHEDKDQWVRLIFVSSTVLVLSVFSLGVLKVVGAGEQEHDHNAHAGSSSPSVVYPNSNYTNVNLEAMNRQLDFMYYQLLQMEANRRGYYQQIP